jgi:branched-subunit amino acid transport protein AzlD
MPADDTADWRDAVRWWERRRITYNAVLTALFVVLTIRTWPRLQPELGPDKILPLLVLALLANLCYSTAYLLDPLLSASLNVRIRHGARLAVWVAGMFLAMLIETYWFLDEILLPPLT